MVLLSLLYETAVTPMVGKINALLDLRPTERRLLYQSCYWLVRVRRRLERKPFQQVLQRVKRWAGTGNVGRSGAGSCPAGARDSARAPGAAGEAAELRALCSWIERCARNLPGRYTCLPQALAGYIVCTRHGYAPELRVGVARGPQAELQAHAWLEFDGKVILGDLPDLQNYRVFDQAERLVQ